MKKVAAVVAGLIMLALPLRAEASGIDVHKDKAQHIGVCYATELVLAEVKPFKKWKPWQRILFTTIVIGGGKEWYDSRHPDHHSAEWGDVAADFVGAASAEGTIWLIHKSF
jgi:uncharacterized protein YfiM (DUF2279 family)